MGLWCDFVSRDYVLWDFVFLLLVPIVDPVLGDSIIHDVFAISVSTSFNITTN